MGLLSTVTEIIATICENVIIPKVFGYFGFLS